MAAALGLGAAIVLAAWILTRGRRRDLAAANAALQASKEARGAERERLRVTLETMSEAVLIVAADGTVEFMNEAAAALTGRPVGEGVGQPLAAIGRDHPGQPGGAVAELVATAARLGRAVDLPPHSVLHARPDVVRQVEGRAAPWRDPAGRSVGVVLVLRDVTQLSRSEADLVRASKMESIGVLAGGIAHDFNNLLSIVMGNLTLAMMDERVVALGGRWLREAERGTVRAKDLTQQLLTFARRSEPVRVTVRLAEVVAEAAEFALHGSAVRCEFDLAADLRPADVDKVQIGQVVQNLVINAVQAMPRGGTIRIRLVNEQVGPTAVGPLAPGQYVRIEFSDTGEGIPAEDLPRVFDPFFTTKAEGTGLGLATVYSVVQKHGGHVDVESALGRGTTFRVWLPAAQSEPAPVAAAPAASLERVSGRVLFMDDEEPIRVMTQALLDRMGLEVVMTSDGGTAVREYAIAQISGKPFDLVIFDLTVSGGMGGADAMREILKIHPGARGIVSSGYTSDPVMADFRAHGFLGSVPKPYRMADFTRTIHEVLEAR